MLTTAFVSDARSFIRRTSRPLLASPSQVAQTLHWYDSAEVGYLLSLGEWRIDPPPVPTWREFFISQGIAHQTEKDAEAIWEDHLISLSLLQARLIDLKLPIKIVEGT